MAELLPAEAVLREARRHPLGDPGSWVRIDLLELRSAVLLGVLSAPLVHQPARTTANKPGEMRRKIRCFAGAFERRRTAAVSPLCIDSTEVKANADVDSLCTLHSGEPFEGTLRGARQPKEDRGLRHAAPGPYVSATDALCPRSGMRLSKTMLVRARTVVKRTLG